MTNPQTRHSEFLSFVHFGDLHITGAYEENHLDFLELIEEVNDHLAGDLDFAFLPGDNADDGSEAQYTIVRAALDRLHLPVHAITGDHDRKAGSLDLFRKYLEPDLHRTVDLRSCRLLFLNAMDGAAAKDFDFSSKQIKWLEEQLIAARSAGLRPLVFTHLYPSELLTQAGAFTRLIREFPVELVEMGHTHYNELANDGHTIYAVTRSTGQIEEGPPGFSLTAIDGDVVSWKFKERGPWPFAMITSPADARLITRPKSQHHVLRGTVLIRAKIWDSIPAKIVTCSIDDGSLEPMRFAQGHWEFNWDSSRASNGIHQICVRANHESGEAEDRIPVLVSQDGRYTRPERSDIDYENAIGADPVKCILGTQLGPNENGTKGPWPSWRPK
jgi:Icc protein